MMDERLLRRRIRLFLTIFIAGLLISGLTALPLVTEARWLAGLIGPGTSLYDAWPALGQWIATVHAGIEATAARHGFLFYGTDWLAFAHIVIAIAFLGPLRSPEKNIWVLQFGMIACVLVIPFALIMGPLRGIPFFWRLFDCCFGIFGFLPLWLAYRATLRLSEYKALTPEAGSGLGESSPRG